MTKQKNQQNLQDLFLNAARKQHAKVDAYLVNGIKLSGTIQSFDNYVVLLSSAKGLQVVYKHAISTIAPTSDFRFDPLAASENDVQE